MNDEVLRDIGFNNFNLPIILDNDYQYSYMLVEKLNQYMEEIKIIKSFPSEIIENTQENIKLITDSLSYYYNADIDKAKKNIFNLLSKYKNNPFIFSALDNSYAFRGLAPFDNLHDPSCTYSQMNTKKLSFFKARIGTNKFTREDMLHIPFHKRDLIKTQRFSIPGVPCLYLGTTSYVCWLEMNKPQDNEFNVSSYKIPGELTILNLVGEQMLINGQASNCLMCSDEYKIENINALKAMIEFFPIICATSYTIRNTDRQFKSEYIISQLVMQCLEELNINGIAYVSKKVSNGLIGYPQCVNLAIPIKFNGNLMMDTDISRYGELCSCITLTDSVNLSEYQKVAHSYVYNDKYSYINSCFTDGYFSLIELSGREIPYRDCTFSKFDNFLCSLEHKVSDIFDK